MPFKGDLEALVLGILQEGDLHGYEIGKRIGQVGPKDFQVWEGQLYPVLHKLEREELVSATWIPQEGKPARKVYAITAKGAKRLVEHRQSWKDFALGIDAVLAPKTPGRATS